MRTLRLFEIIQDSPNSPIRLGMSLNKFAMFCKGPPGWTFPWASTFPGSLEYGDLLITLDLDEEVVRIVGMRIKLWDIAFPDDGDPHPIPLAKIRYARGIRFNLEGFYPGQSISEVQAVLDSKGIGHCLKGGLEHTEVGNRIIANGNTEFGFCRDETKPWLMSIDVLHELHPLWPIADVTERVAEQR